MWRVIEMAVVSIISLVACCFAALSGTCLAFFWLQKKDELRRQRRIRRRYLMEASQERFGAQNKRLVQTILKLIQRQSDLIHLKPQGLYLTRGVWAFGAEKFKTLFLKAGIESDATFQGACHTRALLCIGGAFFFSVIGVIFSIELMVLGIGFGAVLGWKACAWACKQEAKSRKKDLEDHLSEMLEVVSLGLRSGLSFDRSLELYHQHFFTGLGLHAASIQRQWQLGLRTREDALRVFAQAYDSPLFSRVVESIIRSLRLGVSLAENFDSAALEARLIHKAHREEEVAKAPVKMLVPTAALILPAMLLLVLGPVFLEMMRGF